MELFPIMIHGKSLICALGFLYVQFRVLIKNLLCWKISRKIAGHDLIFLDSLTERIS